LTNLDGDMTVSTIASPHPISAPPGPAAPAFADVYRIDIDEFERIAGLLKAERVELIDGFIVQRDAIDPPHVLASKKLRRKLDPVLPDGWFTREDKPVQVHRMFEPLPDLSVVRGDPDTYEKHHSAPADVAMVVEISDSTIANDRGEKQVNYSRGGIAVYWIVNLIDRQVEVYTKPNFDGYASCIVFKPGQFVPVLIDGVEVGQIAVAEILPRIAPAGESNGA
jgi:Uma2 family endonuclease